MNSIRRLAQGDFNLRPPKIIKIPDSLCEEVRIGRKNRFALCIQTDGPLEVRASSSDLRVKLTDAVRSGDTVTIGLEVNSRGETEDGGIECTIDCETDAGEFVIPCLFTFVRPYPEVGGKKIRNIREFAALNAADPAAAADVFFSEDFEALTDDGSREDTLHRALVRQKNRRLAVEEFLTAVSAKNPVRIQAALSQDTITCAADTSVVLTLTAVQPGYAKINIMTDGPFLECDAVKLDTDSFENGRWETKLKVRAQSLHAGINYGRVRVKSGSRVQDLTLAIRRTGDGSSDAEEREEHAKKRLLAIRLTEEYLLFRTGRQSENEWMNTCTQLISQRLAQDPEDLQACLYRAFLYAKEGRMEEAGKIMQLLQPRIEKEYRTRSLLYYGSLYVLSAIYRRREFDDEVRRTLQESFDRGLNAWPMLWMRWQLDKTSDKNRSLWLTRMKDAAARGCSSPVLYLEALSILNQDPLLLRVLNTFERQVLLFGCRYSVIGQPLALQAVDLASRAASCDTADEKLLLALNKVIDDDRILTGLVRLLIRAGRRGKTWFPYYEKAVLRGLNITRLFEYYAMSLEPGRDIRLPKSVLLYFKFGCEGLDAGTTARIYSYVIRHGSEAIQEEYRPAVLKFSADSLAAGSISDDLAVCYRYLYKHGTPDASLAPAGFRAVSSYRVRTSDPEADSVILMTRELKEERRIKLTGGEAFLPVITDHTAFVFEDTAGNRLIGTVSYEMEAVFPDFHVAQSDQLMCLPDPLYQICFFSQHSQEEASRDTIASFSGSLMGSALISDWEKAQIFSWRTAYFDRYGKIPDLPDEHMQLPVDTAHRVIRLFSQHGYFNEAGMTAQLYGVSGMDPGTVLSLATGLIATNAGEDNELTTGLCAYAFAGGCYDERSLRVLQRRGEGSCAQLYAYFSACRETGVDAPDLEERLISQILVTHSRQAHLGEVFTAYCRHTGDSPVTRAFLNAQAYESFVLGEKCEPVFFTAARDRIRRNRAGTSDLVQLALLKHDGEEHFRGLREEELELDQRILDRMVQAGRCFAFFGTLSEKIKLPPDVLDKTVATYQALPGDDVTLICQVTDIRGNIGKQQTIRVKEQICGICTAAFVLFPGERLMGTFREELPDGTVRETPMELYGKMAPEDAGRFGALAGAFEAWKNHDTGKMKMRLRQILTDDYCVRELFTVLTEKGEEDEAG
ncbi:MAG: DUF5717 family protein [Lachnospira sp.]|nr:DUF5717 family protein [Lachnospira sp.]